MAVKTPLRFIAASMAVAGTLLVAGCSSSTDQANNQERSDTGKSLTTFLQAQPVPKYDWSQIRQTLIDVEGAQASSVQTTSFFFMMGMAHPYLVCNSIGYPVASTTQLTNPNQVQDMGSNNGAVISQMDPTGVYAGASAGTYVLCVDPDGKANVQYAEPSVHTVGGPARWNTQTQQIEFTGAPTVTAKVGKK